MSDKNITFEEMLKELETISKKLESQDVPLDEAIELFECGLKLSKNCADKLEEAKHKIERISGGSEKDD